MNSFEIAGIVITENAALSFSQSYGQKEANASTDHQMSDGSTKRQTLAGTIGKLTTRIDGTGWQAVNLAGMSFALPVLLKCVRPRIVNSANETVTLPATRRTDAGYTPTGYAMVAGAEVATAIDNITSDVATLVTVPGATSYHVQYVPEITVLAKFNESYQSSSNSYSWSIDAVEV